MKCLWQRKKEQITNACGKEQTTNAGGKRKMASLSKQLTPNEETKQLKPPQNGPKRLPTFKHKVEKTPKTNKTTKSQQSNRLLSATKEWTTTVIRAQSKNNCANVEQKESQTFHN